VLEASPYFNPLVIDNVTSTHFDGKDRGSIGLGSVMVSP